MLDEIYEFFDPNNPLKNLAGHALMAGVLAFLWTVALGVHAGVGAGMSTYVVREIDDIRKRDEPKWMDGVKDFGASFPGTAIGIFLGYMV